MKKLLALSAATLLTLTACSSEPADPNDENHILGMDREGAVYLCKEKVKEQANFPDSVKFEVYHPDEDVNKFDQDKRWQVRLKFKAKNAFGMESEHFARCFVEPSDAETAIVEASIDKG